MTTRQKAHVVSILSLGAIGFLLFLKPVWIFTFIAFALIGLLGSAFYIAFHEWIVSMFSED